MNKKYFGQRLGSNLSGSVPQLEAVAEAIAVDVRGIVIDANGGLGTGPELVVTHPVDKGRLATPRWAQQTTILAGMQLQVYAAHRASLTIPFLEIDKL